jgi:hypothetical protein
MDSPHWSGIVGLRVGKNVRNQYEAVQVADLNQFQKQTKSNGKSSLNF